MLLGTRITSENLTDREISTHFFMEVRMSARKS